MYNNVTLNEYPPDLKEEFCTFPFNTANLYTTGATQMAPAAVLIHRLDSGIGLLDRFLISIPDARVPSPDAQDLALQEIRTLNFGLEDIYSYVQELGDSRYVFSDEARWY